MHETAVVAAAGAAVLPSRMLGASMTTSPKTKLDTLTRARFGQRAKERRQALKLSCREVSEANRYVQ